MGTPNLNVGYVSASSNTKEVQINAALDSLDEATQGRGSDLVFVANSTTINVTNFKASLEFVVPGGGALTAMGTIVVPATYRVFAIDNRVGGFDVLVKTASGTGVTVSDGGLSLVRGSPTGCYEFTTITGSGVTSVVGQTGIVSLGNLVSGGVAPSLDAVLTGTIDASGATDVLVPTVAYGDNSPSAVSTEHLQTALAASQVKPIAVAVAVTALPANTYINGSSGVGATMTATSNGALVVDGVTPSVNDRILVTAEVSSENNGLYYVVQVGDGSHPFILERHTSMDEPTDFPGALVSTTSAGTTYNSTLWMCTTNVGMTVGTTSVVFEQFLPPGAVDYINLPSEVQNALLTVSIPNKPPNGVYLVIPISQDMTLPANFDGTRGECTTASVADAVYNVGYIRSGAYTAIGTVTFEAGNTLATMSTQAAVSLLSASDSLRVVTPTPQDAALTNAAITFMLKKV